MGLVISRLNLGAPDSRQRSQQDETMYSFYNQTTYSLNKKYFSNYFLMAGERFEIDDPDYLFGDEYDLNFLSCTKPFFVPYKQARQNLLSILNMKQKAICRANRFRSPFNKISVTNSNNSRKQQDDNSKRIPNAPSKPLVMFVNIRKETLKLVMDNQESVDENSTNRVYNIQFYFDSEVDCSIRIFYFCTREVTSNGINYKPQHATYKSKIYYYKKGLEQKFNQQEHTFQPYLFDEDLLMYKPLDVNGNYNSGAVFPLVIHCVALDGPSLKQSYSLVATIEKSQLDDSYSIKPLKQLIFVDGVQYILQDIYGIENKQLVPNPGAVNTSGPATRAKNSSGQKENAKSNTNLALAKSHSLPLSLNISDLNLNDNTSMTSVNFGRQSSSRHNRENSIRLRSLASDTGYECVICMSEERDTMLLPCRHLCLCGSCAQSLRYQASSCPICRCTFRAALNLRSSSHLTSSSQNIVKNKVTITGDSNKISPSSTTLQSQAAHSEDGQQSDTTVAVAVEQSATDKNCTTSVVIQCEQPGGRRESMTTSTTPLLSGPTEAVDNKRDSRWSETEC